MPDNFQKCMQYKLLGILRCPVTGTKLHLKVIRETERVFETGSTVVISEGILYSETGWFYPIIKGVPRLNVESFSDHKDFLRENMEDYDIKAAELFKNNYSLLEYVLKKNTRTKKSFAKEWNRFDYKKDKTWDADDRQMIERFFTETGGNENTFGDRQIFDAGCGNGKLNCLLGDKGIENIGMDFTPAIEAAYTYNNSIYTHFIQGDIQFPPLAIDHFDLVHCSGVLIHTNNAELSFSCLTPLVKEHGKLSVWLYKPNKGFIHNSFNFIRRYTSKLPLNVQYYLYRFTLFPISYLIKKIKRNPQTPKEMMIDILDWFTPEFRWEHTADEVTVWYYKRNFTEVKVTDSNAFGFNITGIKKGIL